MTLYDCFRVLDMTKALIIVFSVAVIAIVGCQFISGTPDAVVTNFEQCVGAGNPVMESYPRQCRHEGVTYVEELQELVDDTPTSADDAPPGSMHNLPVPAAVSAVRAKIASDLGIREGIVIVMTAYERTWSNGCLDLQRPDEICTDALVQGYEVTAEAQGRQFIYHTNEDGSVLRIKK